MKKYYRIVDVDKDGNFKTLFHSVKKTRDLPKEKWLESKQKMVSEGVNGKKYLSGFHVLPTMEECLDYGKKFKKKINRRIISLYCKNLRPKEHSTSNVKLANEIYIPKDCEIHKLI